MLIDDYRNEPTDWKLHKLAAHYRGFKLHGIIVSIPADIYALLVLEDLIDV
jgi:hypothetical protein